MLGNVAVKNGTLIPASQASVPVDDLPFTYGYGVYENFAVRNRILSHPSEHLARLAHSAAQIGLGLTFTQEELLGHVLLLVQAIPDESFNVKLLAVGKDTYVFASAPKYLSKTEEREGVAVVTVHAERSFPRAKTLNMLASFVAYGKAKDQGAYDALLIDRDGRILEGTRTNLFFTDGTTIFTAPADLVLAGVTRSHLIAALGDIPFEERALNAEEVGQYAGFFLTSTSAGAIPIRSIDGTAHQIPAIIRTAITRYDAAQQRWRAAQTPVPAISPSTKNAHKV